MALETKLLLIGMAVMAIGLTMSVLRVLGAWADHHIARHDLIAESKRRRLDYMQAVAERQNGGSELAEHADDSVIIEDHEDEPARRAA